MVSKLKFIMILFGPPGVGKGTLGSLLAKEFQLTKISSGDILREEASRSTPLSAYIRQTSAAGNLIDDSHIIQLIKNYLRPDCPNLLLDGFPRTEAQAEFTIQFARENDFRIFCLVLSLRRDLLVRKLAGRVICPVCHKNYNTTCIDEGEHVMRPILPSEEDLQQCQGCGNLQTRADDTPEVINKRIDDYERSFEAVLRHFRGFPVLDFEVKRGVEDFGRLREVVANQLVGEQTN